MTNVGMIRKGNIFHWIGSSIKLLFVNQYGDIFSLDRTRYDTSKEIIYIRKEKMNMW